MATEAQIKANQQNAQRSTGPKTEEGKQQSARNSLKHGLTGQALIQPEGEEADLLQLRVHEWTASFKPQTPDETWLVTAAAIATARIDRCVRYESATIDERIQKLPETFAAKQKQDLEATLAILKTDPSTAHRQLLSSATGCRHLLQQWQILLTRLTDDRCGHWSPASFNLALELLGDPFHELVGIDHENPLDPDLLDLARLALATQPDKVVDPYRANRYITPPRLSYRNPTPEEFAALRAQLPDPAQSREALIAFTTAQIDDLQEMLPHLEAQEAREAARARDLALFDNSPEATRLQRYEAALHRQLKHYLTRLDHLRNTHTKKSYELAPPAPEPARPQPATPIPSRKNEPNFPLYELDPPPTNTLNITVGRPLSSRHNQKNQRKR